jgi:hypothetical protein
MLDTKTLGHMEKNMDMPVLSPVPIRTKNETLFIQLWRWITSIRSWQLTEDWKYRFEGKEIIIPKGFEFDGASIPRPLWFLLSPTGLLLIPGLIHDFGYRYDYLWVADEGSESGYSKCFDEKGRKFWDEMFLRVGQEVNGITVINFLAWLALFLLGFFAWNSNRNNNDDDIYPT